MNITRHFAQTPWGRISYLQTARKWPRRSVRPQRHHQCEPLAPSTGRPAPLHCHASIAPDQPVSFEDQADMLREFLDTLDINPIDLVATSRLKRKHRLKPTASH